MVNNESMEMILGKAQTLIEALPYIQKFNGKKVVVKYGGSAMVDDNLKYNVIKDVALLKLIGMEPIIVHGGGKEISAWLKKIEEQLGYAYDGTPLTINFTPHLVPMNRGILVTAYANLVNDYSYEDIKAVYDKYYGDETFIRVLNKGVCPETRWVEGSNYVDINFVIDPRTKRVVAMGAMDNLVKGAAGQAVQNMNLIMGLPENEGLMMPPMFP